MGLAFAILGLGVFLFLVQEFFRRAGGRAGWLAFAALPFALSFVWVRFRPTWPHVAPDAVFPWVKLYSIVFAACCFTALRHTPLGRRRWAAYATFAVLVVNVLEAVYVDLLGDGLPHFVNAAFGVLLIALTADRMHEFGVDFDGPWRDVHWNATTRGLTVGYTLWNWTFVYLNYPVVAGHQIAVLAAALAVGIVKPARWLQARIYTLALDFMLMFSFPMQALSRMDTADWSSPFGEKLAAGAGACYFLLLTAWSVACSSRRQGRRDDWNAGSAGDSPTVDELMPSPL